LSVIPNSVILLNGKYYNFSLKPFVTKVFNRTFDKGKRYVSQHCLYTDATYCCGTRLRLMVLIWQSFCPVLWMVDHTSFVTCHYVAGFYTAAKLYCLVAEAQVCEQLAVSCVLQQQWPNWGSKPRPLVWNPTIDLTSCHPCTISEM